MCRRRSVLHMLRFRGREFSACTLTRVRPPHIEVSQRLRKGSPQLESDDIGALTIDAPASSIRVRATVA